MGAAINSQRGLRSGQEQKGKEQPPKQVSVSEGLEERSEDPLRLRDGLEQNVAGRCAQPIVQSEVINISRIERGGDQFGADEKPQDRQRHWPEEPRAQLSHGAFALEDEVHRAISGDEQSHVFLAGEDGEQPSPMRAERTAKPRLKHQKKERRRERFGVEFMERDEAGGGRDQDGTRPGGAPFFDRDRAAVRC